MEFVDFLKYGAIGISLALAILSYRLLSKEQEKDAVRPEMLKSIKNYFLLAIFLSVFFGSTELVLKITGKNISGSNEILESIWSDNFGNCTDSTIKQKANRISQALSENIFVVDTVSICSSVNSELELCRNELETYDRGFYQNIIKLKKAINNDPDGWINLEFQTDKKQEVVNILKSIFASLGNSTDGITNTEVVNKWKTYKQKWESDKPGYIFQSDVTCLVKEFLVFIEN